MPTFRETWRVARFSGDRFRPIQVERFVGISRLQAAVSVNLASSTISSEVVTISVRWNQDLGTEAIWIDSGGIEWTSVTRREVGRRKRIEYVLLSSESSEKPQVIRRPTPLVSAATGRVSTLAPIPVIDSSGNPITAAGAVADWPFFDKSADKFQILKLVIGDFWYRIARATDDPYLPTRPKDDVTAYPSYTFGAERNGVIGYQVTPNRIGMVVVPWPTTGDNDDTNIPNDPDAYDYSGRLVRPAGGWPRNPWIVVRLPFHYDQIKNVPDLTGWRVSQNYTDGTSPRIQTFKNRHFNVNPRPTQSWGATPLFGSGSQTSDQYDRDTSTCGEVTFELLSTVRNAPANSRAGVQFLVSKGGWRTEPLPQARDADSGDKRIFPIAALPNPVTAPQSGMVAHRAVNFRSMPLFRVEAGRAQFYLGIMGIPQGFSYPRYPFDQALADATGEGEYWPSGSSAGVVNSGLTPPRFAWLLDPTKVGDPATWFNRRGHMHPFDFVDSSKLSSLSVGTVLTIVKEFS